MSDEPMSKAEMLDRVSAGWEDMQRLLAGLDAATLERVDPETGWAITDHLFHLAAWERGVAYLIAGRLRYEGMGITPEEWRELDTDQTNEIIFERNRRRPAQDALVALREGHQAMLDALAPLADTDLQRPYADYDLAEGLYPDHPISGWISGDTYDHYAEHSEAIRRALAAG